MKRNIPEVWVNIDYVLALCWPASTGHTLRRPERSPSIDCLSSLTQTLFASIVVSFRLKTLCQCFKCIGREVCMQWKVPNPVRASRAASSVTNLFQSTWQILIKEALCFSMWRLSKIIKYKNLKINYSIQLPVYQVHRENLTKFKIQYLKIKFIWSHSL